MPNYYNPYPYYYSPVTTPAPVMQQTQQPPQAQNVGGFVSVRNEEEAMKYPVAPGASVIFKDENVPYIYTKTMGFSQLDRPVFDKYKLVKEEPTETPRSAENDSFVSRVDDSAINELKGEIKAIWDEIDALKQPAKKPAPKRKEEGDD